MASFFLGIGLCCQCVSFRRCWLLLLLLLLLLFLRREGGRKRGRGIEEKEREEERAEREREAARLIFPFFLFLHFHASLCPSLLRRTTPIHYKKKKSRAEEIVECVRTIVFFSFSSERWNSRTKQHKERQSPFSSFYFFRPSPFLFSFSELAFQTRGPQLDVRLRFAPSRHRCLDRAVGLRGGDVDVVVELLWRYLF